jgi:hypothetical protein
MRIALCRAGRRCSSPPGSPCSPRSRACSARRPRWVDPATAVVAAAGLVWLVADALWTRLAWRRAPLRWERELPPALPVGVERVSAAASSTTAPSPGRARCSSTSTRRSRCATCRARRSCRRSPPVRLSYRARAMRRGPVAFAPAELRLASRGGAWELRRRLGGEAVLRVYPNFAAVAR